MVSRKHSLIIFVLLTVVLFCIASCSDDSTRPSGKTVQPYAADANTILLDHMNQSTLGAASNVTYGSSCASLRYCCILDGPQYGTATYIQYAATDPLSIADGTLEAWVWIDGDFNEVTMASQGPGIGAPSGWTFHLSVVQSGTSGLQVRAHVWSGFALESNSTIELRKWNHIAFTWGSRGAELWINGELDATDTSTAHAASGYGGHLILRTSSDATVKIDEVRISDIQREEFYSMK